MVLKRGPYFYGVIMKGMLVLLLGLFAFQVSAKEKYPNYKIDLNWDDKATLEDNVTQQCDDSYYPKVEIKIPGKPGKDFQVEMAVDVTTGKIVSGCKLELKKGTTSSTYVVDADSYCTIRVFQMKPKAGERAKTAVYDISDAC